MSSYRELALEHLRYHAWATERVLQVVEPLTEEELAHDWKNSHGGIWGTLEHLYQADEVWLARHQGQPYARLNDFQTSRGIPALRDQWERAHAAWLTWAEKLTESAWENPLGYRLMNGQESRTPIFKNILHVVNHGSYHRGQVITMLRQSGRPVIGTDFVLYVREKKE